MPLWLIYALWGVWGIYLVMTMLVIWVVYRNGQYVTSLGKATTYGFLTVTPFWVCWNIWG